MKTAARFLGIFCIFALLGAFVLQPSPSRVSAATVINVTTTDDELNSDGDCSLREAVRASITNSAVSGCPAGSSTDTDEIVLPAGVYTLTIAGPTENDSETGDLDLYGKMRLVGAGRDLTTVQGGSGWNDRIFEIRYQISNDAEITIEKMTIQNGRPPDDENGGGIHVFGTSDPSQVVVTLKEVRLQNNRAVRQLSGGEGRGGGLAITNTPTVYIYDSLIQNNSGDRGGGISITKGEIKRSAITGNQAVQGSAIFVAQAQPILIENTTISGNGIGSDYPSQNYMILADFGAQVTIRYSTIANNNTASGFGGVNLGAGQIILQGTILSGNGNGNNNSNCVSSSSPLTSHGFNLSSDNSCSTYLNQLSDLNGTDALLHPLGFYGKALPHHPPKLASPAATDPGTSSCPSEDQLGTVRPPSSCTRGAVQNILVLVHLPLVSK